MFSFFYVGIGFEDLFVEVIVDLGEEIFDGGKFFIEGVWVDGKVEFGVFELVVFVFEDIVGKIYRGFDFDGDFFVFFRDFIICFDVVGFVIVVIIVCVYDDDLFEVGDVDYFYVGCVGVYVVWVRGWELVDLIGDDVVIVVKVFSVGVGEIESFVLFRCMEVFVFFLFVNVVVRVRGDKVVVSWVVDRYMEGECFFGEYLFVFGNDFSNFGGCFRGFFYMFFLVEDEIIYDGG